MTITKIYPKVYVIVLAYNQYQLTHECLESLLKSEQINFETVLVDNGSTDHTPDLTRQNFPAVYVIENGQNLGLAGGFNVGISYALQQNADYILLLNNDTILANDMIAKLVDFAEQDPKAAIIMPKVLIYGSTSRVWSSGGVYRIFPPSILLSSKRKSLHNKTRLIEFAPSCALLIHRRAFEQAGLFDTGFFYLFDDWDFSTRVRDIGLNIWYYPSAQIWHKVSMTTKGSQSPMYWWNYGAGIVRYYRRHGKPFWFSLAINLGYILLREFFWKQNWKFWSDFWSGFWDAFYKPLGNPPQYA